MMRGKVVVVLAAGGLAMAVAALAVGAARARAPGPAKPPVALGVGASLGGRRPFPPDSPWNLDISRAPLDPNSDRLIASIGPDAPLHPDFGTKYGIPYVVVAGAQPKVPVRFEYADESDPGPYPIPPDPPIEGGPDSTGDRHILMIDRDRWVLLKRVKGRDLEVVRMDGLTAD